MEEEQFFCSHPTDQLLVCMSEGCKDDQIKHIACSKCFFATHNHELMAYKKLSDFERYCYKISPLLNKKNEIEEVIKIKFYNIRNKLLEQLNRKQEYLLNKLNSILPNDIAITIKQAFSKNQIIQLMMPEVAKQIISKINNVEKVEEQLNKCVSEIAKLRLNDSVLYKNNIDESLVQEEISKNNPEQEQNQKVKAQNKENYRSMKCKYIPEVQQKQHHGMIIMNLEDIMASVPAEIVGHTFSDASDILKNNYDLTNLSIVIQFKNEGNKSVDTEEALDLRELCKKKFFFDLTNLTSIQTLNINVGTSDRITTEDVMNLETALITLDTLKSFKASYYASDQEALIYQFVRLAQKLGGSNVQIRAFNSTPQQL